MHSQFYKIFKLKRHGILSNLTFLILQMNNPKAESVICVGEHTMKPKTIMDC